WIGARLAPIVRFYQWVLYPIAKPTARLLDKMLGAEGISYMREEDLRQVIKLHMRSEETDLDHLEGVGALNFLAFDDLSVEHEGELVDPVSVIALPTGAELPIFPDFARRPDDPFIRQLHASRQKWIVITDMTGTPRLALDADGFLREALLDEGPCNPYAFCHRPMVVTDPATPIGPLLAQLRVEPEGDEDDVVDLDLILLWGAERRVVTGADLLGRLLRGIATRGPAPDPPAAAPSAAGATG
ncbi:MAG: CNNM domain-containing protein, partial [Chloroflexi bacterium]|nr:CNNM domain-containing protein [Chloroflexota bacterium]